jgi:hypothetical protein
MDDRFQHFAAHPYFLMGAKHERNRIIVILKANLHCDFINSDILGNFDHSEHCEACALIELVNGDKE